MRAIAVAILITSLAATADELPPDVAEPVARAIFQRGVEVYKQGEVDLARHLFREAFVADPRGPQAETARTLVKMCEYKLGLPAEELVAPPAPIDPYAAPPVAAPLDPYG